MKQADGKSREGILLTEDHIYFGGMHLTYQLYVLAKRTYRLFRIRVEKAEEFAEGELGNDLKKAIELYQSILEGTVTPCTLEDVLLDLQYA
ncbi:MAG: hypothetical protein IJW49_11955 [Clostridia bacterium]|nr:hypothetical protein [Clostridia bacterium]MBQ9807201.1 hypothetical protein [Clostridia bacterium]